MTATVDFLQVKIIPRFSCTSIFVLIIVDLIRGIILVTVIAVSSLPPVLSVSHRHPCYRLSSVCQLLSPPVVGISIIRVFSVISVSGVVSLIRGICIIIIVIIITVIEMLVTVFSRHGTYVKVFCDHRAAGSWEEDRFLQTLNFSHTCRHIEISVSGSPSWIRVITFSIELCGSYGHNQVISHCCHNRTILHMYNMVYNPQTTGHYRPRLYLFFRQQAYCQAGRLYLYTCFTTSSIALVEKKSSTFFDHGTFGSSILDQDISVVIQNFLCIINRFDIVSPFAMAA